MINVNVSELGHYGFVYWTTDTIEVSVEDLEQLPFTNKVVRANGYKPMKVSAEMAKAHSLNSSVVWRKV